MRRGHKQDDFLSLRFNREDAEKTQQIIQSLKGGWGGKKQRNIHIYPARSSCSLTRVGLSRVLPASVRLEIHCVSVGLCRCVCADGELMGFFLRKIGLLRETSCNEGRTEGKKWTAQEMVTQLAWKSSYFE